MAHKLALQAVSWYTKGLELLCSRDALTPLGTIANLYRRRATMETLPLFGTEDNPPEKCCTVCGNSFPATTEFFHGGGNRNGKPRLHTQCKKCRGNKIKERQQQPEAKERVRLRRRAYRSQSKVKEQERAYRIDYDNRAESRERKRARNRAFYSQPENRAQKQAHDRAYGKMYQRTPHGRAILLAARHRRIARKKRVAGSHTSEQIQSLLVQQKHKCYYCSVKFGKKDNKYIYHIEHTFPLNRVAGTDIPANDISYLVLSCPTCNLKKGDKFPWEWHEGGRLF